MQLSPRQLMGWLHFARITDNHIKAETLLLSALADRGDKKTIDKHVKELTKD